MKRAKTLCLLALAATLGCADGGPVGTGIGTASSVSGNILEVVGLVDGMEQSGANLPPVTVIVEGTDLQDTTDAQGNFAIFGPLAGDVTLAFATPLYEVSTSFALPAGSDLVLENIRISPDAVEPIRLRLLRFYGQVQQISCSTEDTAELLVSDRRSTADQFDVELTRDTVVVDTRGDNVECAAALVNSQVAIEGVLRRDPDTLATYILAIAVVFEPPPPGEPRPIVEVRFEGIVSLVNCSQDPAGIVFVDDLIGLARLQLWEVASVLDASLTPLTCASIEEGDHIRGTGLAKSLRPDVIEVDTMRVNPVAVTPP